MEAATIQAERLLLRPFRETDHRDLYEFLAQLENDEFEGYPGITFENSLAQLRERLGSEEYLAMELKESGKVVGNVYCGMREFCAREVGYIVNEDYLRRGLAAEELTAAVEAAFRAGVHRVFAECDPRNEPSWRLLEKVGFRREGHLRQNTFFHRGVRGEPIWKDTYIYARLNEADGGLLPSSAYPSALGSGKEGGRGEGI